MNKKDIELLCEILTYQKQNSIVELISDGLGLLEESGTYGSYWNSILSSYTIFLDIKKYFEVKKISDAEKKIILDALLEIYPHTDSSPEITSLSFKILRDLPEGFPEPDKIKNKDDIIAFEHGIQVQYNFLLDQIGKAEEKYKNNDLDGSLTNIRTCIEAATFDIYKRITGEEIVGTGSLQDDYKKVKTLLNLAPENKTNIAAKKMVSAFMTAIDSIDEIANDMGDRHLRKVKPEPHHVAFCLNSTKTVLNFLYSSLIYQYKNKNSLYEELLEFLDIENNRNLDKEVLLKKKELAFMYMRCDFFTKNLLKNKLISEFEINNFRKSDIFFKFLDIFSDTLKKIDIDNISNKYFGNGQACGLKDFLAKYTPNFNSLDIKD